MLKKELAKKNTTKFVDIAKYNKWDLKIRNGKKHLSKTSGKKQQILCKFHDQLLPWKYVCTYEDVGPINGKYFGIGKYCRLVCEHYGFDFHFLSIIKTLRQILQPKF